jgi:sugar (glycoside-pentoside-hexuronide) transporter
LFKSKIYEEGDFVTQMTEEKRFNRNKWTYTVPGIGRDMAYTLFANFLLSYVLFTRSVTVQQFAAISVILTIARIWDAINDPVMGGIIENTRTKVGKFKPWIIIGAILNAVVLIYTFSNRLEGWSFVVAFGICYFFWDITWTMNDIGYWSMLPSLTSEPKKRDKLTSFANLFAMIGAILAMGLIPILTNGSAAIGGSSISGFRSVAIFIAVTLVVSQIVVYFFVKENKTAHLEKDEHIGLKKMVSVIFKNDQLLWVALIMLLYNVGSALLTAFGVNYMYLSFGYNGTYVTMFVAFYALASVAINILYPKLAAKMSRRKMSTLAMLTNAIGYIMFMVFGTLLPSLGVSVTVQLVVMLSEAFIIGFGQSLLYMTITIYLTNTIEYNEFKTGSRDEAIIFSLRPFMAKMGSALQQVIIMVAYIAIGMTTITNGISEIEKKASLKQISEAVKTSQIEDILANSPPSITFWLRVCMVVAPLVLITAAYFVMRSKVKLDEENYKEMLAEIEARKAKPTGDDE